MKPGGRIASCRRAPKKLYIDVTNLILISIVIAQRNKESKHTEPKQASWISAFTVVSALLLTGCAHCSPVWQLSSQRSIVVWELESCCILRAVGEQASLSSPSASFMKRFLLTPWTIWSSAIIRPWFEYKLQNIEYTMKSEIGLLETIYLHSWGWFSEAQSLGRSCQIPVAWLTASLGAMRSSTATLIDAQQTKIVY